MQKIIPRDDLLDAIVKNAQKGRHTWLVAPEGFGKTTLIREAVDELEDAYKRDVVVCSESPQFKPLMLDIARQLHERGLFHWDKIENIASLDWSKLHAKLNRPPVTELAPVVIQNLEGHNIILVLDHLDNIWPSYQQHYARLFEVCTILAASESFRSPQLKKLRSYARVIEVPKFTTSQAEELSDFLFESLKINAHDEEMFKRHILRAADGVPLKLRQLYEDASAEKFINQDFIRKLRSQAGREFTSMGWLLLALLALPMAARIVAVGSGDRDGFIAFGIMTAFAFVIRYVVYRASRKI